MKTLLALATIALTFASGALTAHAQGPFPPPPGGGFPGREFGPYGPGPGRAYGPAYAPEGREFYRRHHAPEYRRVPPPEPYCAPPVRVRPPLAGLLRFVFER